MFDLDLLSLNFSGKETAEFLIKHGFGETLLELKSIQETCTAVIIHEAENKKYFIQFWKEREDEEGTLFTLIVEDYEKHPDMVDKLERLTDPDGDTKNLLKFFTDYIEIFECDAEIQKGVEDEDK